MAKKKLVHKNMIAVIGKKDEFNQLVYEGLIEKSQIDGTYNYIKGLVEDEQVFQELLERNSLRYWEPYISKFKEEVNTVIRERIIARENHKSNRVTLKQERLVRKIYRCGYSTRAVSDALGGMISHSKVSEIVSNLPKENIERRGQVVELLEDLRGLDLRKYLGSNSRKTFKNNSNNQKTKIEVIDYMFKLYRAGYKVPIIAQECSVPETTVSNYIERYFRFNQKGYTVYDAYKEEQKNRD